MQHVLCVLYWVAGLWLFWLLTVNYAGAVMYWQRLTYVHKILIGPLVGVFGALDVLLNFTLASLVFWRSPPSLRHVEAFKHPFYWTLMHRLAVYKNNPNGWRQRLAVFVCEKVLDPFRYGYCH
jgi:hypothetical protein